FLAFLMNSNALWDFANSNAAGTMSKRVKWRDLAEYEFLLPPKEQQAQLAKLLWAMDEVIEGELKTYLSLTNYFESSRNTIFSKSATHHPLNVCNESDFREEKFENCYKTKSVNGIYKSKEFQGRGI